MPAGELIGRAVQSRIYRAGAMGRRPTVPMSPQKLEAAARRRLSRAAYAYNADRALDAGVDGIIVSNHGGRQVDGAVASLDALPPIVERVGGQVPVLFDSGIRSGSDAFTALALGARAVLVGRPYAYGLALAGADGVREVLDHLRAELDITMVLAGCSSIEEISADTLTAAA